MILAIISSNDILIKNMAYYIPKNITQVVCGNESLIDKEVISYSKKYGIPYKVFELQKNIQPEIANRVRNEVVSEYADNFILFWDGKDENILKLSNICEYMWKKRKKSFNSSGYKNWHYELNNKATRFTEIK